MKLKNYTEFLNENELEDYKDNLLNTVIDTQPKEKEEEPEVEDQTFDQTKNNFEAQIEEFETQKQGIADKLLKIEELLTNGQFTDENRERLEQEKEKLQLDVDKFEELLGKAQGELKQIQDNKR